MGKVGETVRGFAKWLFSANPNDTQEFKNLTPQEEEIRRIAVSDFEDGRTEPPQRPGRLRDIYIKAQEFQEWASRQF
jgi:hypothetical protein